MAWKRRTNPQVVVDVEPPPRADALMNGDEDTRAMTSDEGVPVVLTSTTELVNVATEFYDAHRVCLHIAGRVFMHVGEGADGRWLYRFD